MQGQEWKGNWQALANKPITPDRLLALAKLTAQVSEKMLQGALHNWQDHFPIHEKDQLLALNGPDMPAHCDWKRLHEVEKRLYPSKEPYLANRDVAPTEFYHQVEAAEFSPLPWETAIGHFDALSEQYIYAVFVLSCLSSFNPFDNDHQEALVSKPTSSIAEWLEDAPKDLLMALSHLCHWHRPTRAGQSLFALQFTLEQYAADFSQISNLNKQYYDAIKCLKNRLLWQNKSSKFTHYQESALGITLDSEVWLKSEEKQIVQPLNGNANPLWLETNRLYRRTGLYHLSVAWQFIAMHHETNPFFGPVLLVQAQLQKDAHAAISVSFDKSTWQINPMLRIWYMEQFNRFLPKECVIEETSHFLQTHFTEVLSPQTHKLNQDAVLDIFKPTDAALLEDFREIAQHPPPAVLQPFFQEPSPETIREEKDPGSISFAEDYSILAADPDQHRAISRAMQGEHLVVHGPPGTGKTQVAVNMVSNFIARGKKVLFVSDKKAALDVLWHRLAAGNLHYMCLKLHHSQRDLAEVYDHIKKAWNWLNQPPATYMEGVREVKTQNVERAFNTQKGIEDAYQKKLPSGFSYKELLIKLSEYQRTTTLHGKDFSFTHVPWFEYLAQVEKQLLELEQLLETKGCDTIWLNNPFMLADAGYYSGQVNAEQIWTSDLSAATAGLEHLIEKQNELFHDLNLSIGDWEKVLNWCSSVGLFSQKFPVELLLTETAVFKQFDKWKLDHDRKTRTLERRKTRTRLASPPPVYQVNSAIETFKEGGRRNKKKVKRFLDLHFDLDNEPFGDDFAEMLKQLLDEAKAEENLALVQERLLGHFGINQLTDFQEEQELLLDITRRTQRIIPDFFAWLLQQKNPSAAVVQIGTQLREASDAFLALRHVYTDYRERLPMEVLPILNQLQNWRDLSGLLQIFSIYGRFPFSIKEGLQSCALTPSELVMACVQKELNEFAERHPDAAQLPFGGNDALQKALFTTYDAWLEANAEEVGDSARKKMLNLEALMQTSAAALTETEKTHKWHLRKGKTRMLQELKKKVRHTPFRQFMETDAGKLLHETVQCWMFSPSSLAEALPCEMAQFDVVVFDEASQLTLEQAIPAIYRSKQCVFLGDTCQLPPSSFFKNKEFAPPPAIKGTFVKAESVLSLAEKHFAKCALNWHYRSKHPALIAISNLALYKGQLKAFPHAHQKVQPFKLHFNQNHSYHEGVNEAEIRIAIHQMTDWLNADITSFAMVVFSQKQREALEKSWESFLESQPQVLEKWEKALLAEEDGVFNGPIIQNLENIQGDERDYVGICTTYGADYDGRFRANLGPVSHEGGERRLNVVFSRAKEQMVLITSMTPEMLQHLESAGAQVLEQFIAFANMWHHNELEKAQYILQKMHLAFATEKADSDKVPVLHLDALQKKFTRWESTNNPGSADSFWLKDSIALHISGNNTHWWTYAYLAEKVLANRGFKVMKFSHKDWVIHAREMKAQYKDYFT